MESASVTVGNRSRWWVHLMLQIRIDFNYINRHSTASIQFNGKLTDIDKSTGRALAELFALVGQRDFHHSWYVSGRRLHPDGMRSNQLSIRTKEPSSSSEPNLRSGRRLTSLHTSMVPKTTCSPSKKLSPTMITCAPPVVQPSLGLIALIQGVAIGSGG